ncbi:hypothetical protein [Phyllobacterium zundukense]|uniref:Uncharacterized protein n=1 Tax=Phyllobacterium zundukense TaxID=1867719 RepID=A0ACD4CZ55_9HYPH|nr:hypothetical protein [Phyllobacterium zundukense]UXN58846.1 hypothetical protein N8E88_08035 [Phyllobacterium zundukense]
MTNSPKDRKALATASRMKDLEHKIHALEVDLGSAVEIAYLRGATEWVRINYPSHYKRLHMRFDSCAA